MSESDEMVVAFDHDDTTWPLHGHLVEHINSRLGKNLPAKGLGSDLALEFGISREQYRELEEEYIFSDEHLEVPPEPGFPELATKMRARGDTLLKITARVEIYREPTIRRVEKHLPSGLICTETGMHFVGNQYVDPSEEIMSKAQAFGLLGVDVIVDDSMRRLHEIVTLGGIAVLYGNYFWNRPATYRGRMFSAHNMDELDSTLSYIRRKFFSERQ